MHRFTIASTLIENLGRLYNSRDFYIIRACITVTPRLVSVTSMPFSQFIE